MKSMDRCLDPEDEAHPGCSELSLKELVTKSHIASVQQMITGITWSSTWLLAVVK